MSRRDRILKFADLGSCGIEIAPYSSPLVSKASGHHVLTLDVFDTERLIENARNDPGISDDDVARIEPVDLVGDASSIAEIFAASGQTAPIGYIVSSHNFEHLPNPIKFLRGCAEILQPGGVISLAVPDGRACFDHFRMPTRLSDWLDAFHNDRAKPDPATIFDAMANLSAYESDGQQAVGCSWGIDDPGKFEPGQHLEAAYAAYQTSRSDDLDYRDTHCSVVFPETMRLMLGDLIFLGLLDLELLEVGPTQGLEFFVHLRKPTRHTPADPAAYYDSRATLLRDVARAMGKGSYGPAASGKSLSRRLRGVEKRGRALLRSVVGEQRFERLRQWHKQRSLGRRR